jgi:hypothetical protein
MTDVLPQAVTTETVLATHTYRDHDISVVAIRRQQAEYTSSGTYRDGKAWSLFHPATDRTRVVGRISGWRNGVSLNGKNREDPQAIIKACCKYLDEAAFDDSIRADVTALSTQVKNILNQPGVEVRPVCTPGTHPEAFLHRVVYVHAMGYWRRGRVTKVGNKRVTVSYTTPSSNGRIFHKSVNEVAV